MLVLGLRWSAVEKSRSVASLTRRVVVLGCVVSSFGTAADVERRGGEDEDARPAKPAVASAVVPADKAQKPDVVSPLLDATRPSAAQTSVRVVVVL